MTIQEVIDLIMREVPDRKVETVDTFKAGDPRATVRGIVTTFIATVGVLKRARTLKANLVITHEPTYFDHLDRAEGLAGDPVLAAKRKLIEESGLTVWRFHDHWHRHKPDGVNTGFARKVGWEKHRQADSFGEGVFRVPPITLRALAALLRRRLGASSVRVCGKPGMKCRVAVTRLGCSAWSDQYAALKSVGADVLICGEAREWEAYEYVRDAAAAGFRKGLIVLGHCASEEPGMEYLAEWLRPRLPGVPVRHVPAGDPFWYA